jgi:hypothetical protein
MGFLEGPLEIGSLDLDRSAVHRAKIMNAGKVWFVMPRSSSQCRQVSGRMSAPVQAKILIVPDEKSPTPNRG